MAGAAQVAAISPDWSPLVARLVIIPLPAVAITPSPVSTTGVSGAGCWSPKPCRSTVSSGELEPIAVPVRVPSRPGALRTATAEIVAVASVAGEVVHTVVVRPTSGDWLGLNGAASGRTRVPPTATRATARRAMPTVSTRRRVLAAVRRAEGLTGRAPDERRPPGGADGITDLRSTDARCGQHQPDREHDPLADQQPQGR